MSTNKAIRQTATRLAAVARCLRAQHGDFAAQAVVCGLVLKRWAPSADVESLLAGLVDRDVVGRVEAELERSELDAARSAYESQGKDPCVYFYEDFLRACDMENARGRGVHYSPPEVVSFIVRGLEALLGQHFGISLDDALVVDPCCGAGTFLRHIERRTSHHPRMVGIELMPTAQTIASCLLQHALTIEGDWLSTDLIDPGGRTLVILGNPPYSGHSSNPGKIADLVADYRHGLNERNPKWLQDDYVKFIRMAQHQVENAGRGVVAFITNHSYLTNPTFRAMRQSLAKTFDQILILDLQGNVKRLVAANENVFPIQMGVAISFFVKTNNSCGNPSTRSSCCVRYACIDGTREEKLLALRHAELANVQWRTVDLVEPFHILKPGDGALAQEYYACPSVRDIFRESTIGFVTSRDAFAIGFTREQVLERMALLRDGKIDSVGDLDVEYARQEILDDHDWEDRAVEVLYRPFDRRWTYYSRAIMERPRLPFMENLMRENTALAIGRAGYATGSDEWDVVFCTDRPADLNLFRRGGAKLFPRYVYRGGKRLSNIGSDYTEPDLLFGYLYAVLHSRIYRSRYSQFLQMDYPRIPLVPDRQVFESLASLGSDLIDVHLMRSICAEPDPAARFTIGGYDIPARWLKDREGIASDNDTRLVQSAVASTLRLQQRIDEIFAEAPPWSARASV